MSHASDVVLLPNVPLKGIFWGLFDTQGRHINWAINKINAVRVANAERQDSIEFLQFEMKEWAMPPVVASDPVRKKAYLDAHQRAIDTLKAQMEIEPQMADLLAEYDLLEDQYKARLQEASAELERIKKQG